MFSFPNALDIYLNDSHFRPPLRPHLAEYRKAVESSTVFENESLESVVAQLKTKDEEIKALKESIGKLQTTVDLMLQGLQARDKQYFERRYPRLKAMDKTGKSERKSLG